MPCPANRLGQALSLKVKQEGIRQNSDFLHGPETFHHIYLLFIVKTFVLQLFKGIFYETIHIPGAYLISGACKLCPAGSSCNATDASPCPAGTASSLGQSACVSCSQGRPTTVTIPLLSAAC